MYDQKCDNCDKPNPKFFVQVYETASGGEGIEIRHWCLDWVSIYHKKDD